MRSFYTALFYAALPAVVGRLLWKGLKAPAYRKRIPERFGRYSSSLIPASNPIWLHAVSVGEAEAAFPLLRMLMERYRQCAFLITTTTPTGSARVRDVFGDSVAHVYLPYDVPSAVNRFLDTFRPSLAVIMETEIWPNLFRATAERQVPLVIVNARLSERSAKGYARVRSLTHESLSAASWIATQSNGDRERFLALGAEPGMVETVGNIKFDRMLPPDFEVLCNQKRAGLFGKRPVFVAGSTHRDEEALLLASARVLWEVYPNLLLVLAPRHPERFPEVADLCRSQKISIACRSETKDSPVITQVLLLDQMGELQLFYGMADIAFVGGSLIAAGGHNPLEPAAAGVPTLFGPNMFNFREISEGILACGAAIQVENAEAFTNAASQLLADARARMEMGAAGRTFVQQGRGALRRIVDRLEQWLPNDSTHNDLTI